MSQDHVTNVNSHRALWLAPTALVLLAILALSVDLPVARWSLEESSLRKLHGLLEVAETFGNGTGVALIALAVHAIDVTRRRAVLRLLFCSWGAGLTANFCKLIVNRSRPYHWFEAGHDDVWRTFGPLFPFGSTEAPEQSFPSSHTATAFGLAVALAWLYPQARWFFGAMAVLVGLQRVCGDAHFTSDVLVGAAVGWVVGYVCCYLPPVSTQFDRFETPPAR